MKEKELIDLGFTKVVIPAEKDEEGFYYFTYDFDGICLISMADTESVDKGYDNAHFGVEIFDSADFFFTEASELAVLIDVLKRNTAVKVS